MWRWITLQSEDGNRLLITVYPVYGQIRSIKSAELAQVKAHHKTYVCNITPRKTQLSGKYAVAKVSVIIKVSAEIV